MFVDMSVMSVCRCNFGKKRHKFQFQIVKRLTRNLTKLNGGLHKLNVFLTVHHELTIH